jgi:hypothetical protein
MGANVSSDIENISIANRQKVNRFKRSKSATRISALSKKSDRDTTEIQTLKFDNRNFRNDINLTRLAHQILVNQHYLRKDLRFVSYVSSKTLNLAPLREPKPRKVTPDELKLNHPDSVEVLEQNQTINNKERSKITYSAERRSKSRETPIARPGKKMQQIATIKPQEKRTTAFDFRKEGKRFII